MEVGGEKTGKYRGGWNWTLTFLGWQISCPTSSWESQSSWKSPQGHWIPPWLISLAPGGSWGPQVSPAFASGTWYLEAEDGGKKRGSLSHSVASTSSFPFPFLPWLMGPLPNHWEWSTVGKTSLFLDLHTPRRSPFSHRYLRFHSGQTPCISLGEGRKQRG